mmetsp:Transcript_43273/g.126038  ORF Transcript_43273/g.126038 Transcript_43273/m.126038 type:complete len:218 (-) Transcript_43273:195-848(-)
MPSAAGNPSDLGRGATWGRPPSPLASAHARGWAATAGASTASTPTPRPWTSGPRRSRLGVATTAASGAEEAPMRPRSPRHLPPRRRLTAVQAGNIGAAAGRPRRRPSVAMPPAGAALTPWPATAAPSRRAAFAVAGTRRCQCRGAPTSCDCWTRRSGPPSRRGRCSTLRGSAASSAPLQTAGSGTTARPCPAAAHGPRRSCARWARFPWRRARRGWP